MDYFSVIVLIIVVFVFMTDRKVKSLEEIEQNKEVMSELIKVKQNLEIITVQELRYVSILDMIKKTQKEYVMVLNKDIIINERVRDTLLANYISNNKKASGFNVTYVHKTKGNFIKKIYIDIINYLNIFNKKELSTYAAIICKKEDLNIKEEEFKQNLISYTPAKCTQILLTKEQLTSKNIKKIYLNKLNKSNINIIFKLFLLIVSGSYITSNLIYTVLNLSTNSLPHLITSLVIYFCYSYIIRYIYKPIGKKRILATYIFPFYFISYILVTVFTVFSKVIKKVHAS